MSKIDMNLLVKTIQTVAGKIQKFKDRSIGEQNTKAALIEPVLEALGWDVRDPDEVHREFKPTSKDCPVDYAFKLQRRLRLFLEAKGLGEDLSDRKWIAQVLGYATVAGVEWCVLSDGDHYRFFNATAAVDAEEKIFRELRISTTAPEKAAETLALITRDNLDENQLSVLWQTHYADKRVCLELRELLQTPDDGIVKLIRKHIPNLPAKEVIASLARLDIHIALPSGELNDCAIGANIKQAEVAHDQERRRVTQNDCLAKAEPVLKTLYEQLRQWILSLDPDVDVVSLQEYIAFKKTRGFVEVKLQTGKNQLIIWLPIQPSSVKLEDGFSRDVSNIGHSGNGNLELRLRDNADLEKAKPLIARSYRENISQI